MNWKGFLGFFRDFSVHVVMTVLLSSALFLLIFGTWYWALAFFLVAMVFGYLFIK